MPSKGGEAAWADPVDLHESIDACKGTVNRAVRHDPSGKRGTDAREAFEVFGRCSVEVEARGGVWATGALEAWAALR